MTEDDDKRATTLAETTKVEQTPGASSSASTSWGAARGYVILRWRRAARPSLNCPGPRLDLRHQFVRAMSSLKAPTTVPELVAGYASLASDEKFGVTGLEGEKVEVANEYVVGVHRVTVDNVITRALWIFHPLTQMAHIEALPSPGEELANTDLKSTELSTWTASKLSSNQAQSLAPSVALGLLKAFVGGFNRRKWGKDAGSASEQGVRSPHALYFEQDQAQTLAPEVRTFLVRIGVPEAQILIRPQPAQDADAALAATAWRQFVLAMQSAPQGMGP